MTRDLAAALAVSLLFHAAVLVAIGGVVRSGGHRGEPSPPAREAAGSSGRIAIASLENAAAPAPRTPDVEGVALNEDKGERSLANDAEPASEADGLRSTAKNVSGPEQPASSQSGTSTDSRPLLRRPLRRGRAALAGSPDAGGAAPGRSPIATDRDHEVRLPRLAVPIEPEYPFRARQLGSEGRVLVTAVVRSDGQAIEVRLAESSGDDDLDSAALDAVRDAVFVPGSAEGPMAITIGVAFELE